MSNQDNCELSILMPCLNEAETLATCISKARRFLETHKVTGEVVVADNGSTDGSAEIAAALGARLVSVGQPGYGAALQEGIAAARGTYVIMGDADDSYDLEALAPFLNALRGGVDLVMGNRFKGEIKPGAMPLLHRYLGNPMLSALGRLFFKSPCGDFHCGLRGFVREKILRLDLRTTGMEFASEMVVKATLSHLKMAEVPIVLYPDGRSRPPHLKSWRDGWRHLRFLLLFSPRWLFFYPGMMFMIGGASAVIWLVLQPRTVGSVTIDVHTLVFAAAVVVIGYQAVLFSVMSKIFALTQGLLPADERFARLFKYFTLEGGLVVGAALVLIGLGMTFYAFDQWRLVDFGDLVPGRMLRYVVPAVLALTIGFQTIFFSFFLSILGLRVK